MTEISGEEVKNIWNENAFFWDEKMGERGNEFHRFLIEPSQERLLSLKEGEYILDIACGNGQFTRKMAETGVRVFAFDTAENFILRAKERSKDYKDKIEYRVIDASDGETLERLGENIFDGAVCTMAIMDMSSLEPLVISLKKILKKNGRFVFSIMHPCFNSGRIRRIIEEEDKDGEVVITCSVSNSHYIKPFSLKGIGMIGQPQVQYYFHRPLSELFNIFFKYGFFLNGLEEPVCPENKGKSNFWQIHAEIPPALIVRMILMNK
jgi:2-polyprenyl-3-methyl-5-hydroxy-6-metoxy-1,4-benzoquinol methylase